MFYILLNQLKLNKLNKLNKLKFGKFFSLAIV
jgi:hypothetical protein